MKLLFKPALTAKWPSDKGLGGHLNRGAGRFPVIRFAAPPRRAARTMSSPAPKSVRYRFGPFELDPAQGRLSRSGSRVKLQDLPLRLLVLLVERPGELVTREEVRQRLWPEDTFVEFDNSLGVAVRKLREALRDDADAPRFVETVPRRGYRFVAPVTVQDADGFDDLGGEPAKRGEWRPSQPGRPGGSGGNRKSVVSFEFPVLSWS